MKAYYALGTQGAVLGDSGEAKTDAMLWLHEVCCSVFDTRIDPSAPILCETLGNLLTELLSDIVSLEDCLDAPALVLSANDSDLDYL